MNLINVEAFWVALLGLWLSYSVATFVVCGTRWHWFAKFMTIAGMAGVLLFIEAPDLMLMVLAQCLTIFLLFAASKDWFARREEPEQLSTDKTVSRLGQIGLSNALLGVAVLCLLLVSVQVDLSDHLSLFISVAFGVSLGIVSALAFWLANTKRWWVGVVIAVACIAGSVAIPKIIFRPPPDDFGEAFQWMIMAAFGRFVSWGELPDFAVSILIANFISIVLLVVTTRLCWNKHFWIKLAARTAGSLLIVAMFSLTAGTVHLYSCLLNGPHVDWPAQQENQINGFDELVVAGKEFDKSRLLIFPEIAATRASVTLKQELDAYSSQFEQAERALKRPLLTSAVSSIDEYDSFSQNYNWFRRVALALDCRAIQHLHETDYDSALNDACLIAELSLPLRRSNSISFVLTAPAIEQMGHVQLVRCVQDASSASLKIAMSRLARIKPADQDLDALYQNDAAIEWASCHWQRRLQLLIWEAASDKSPELDYTNNFRFNNATRRQAIVLMAIELFRRKENRYPANLKSLVPAFLDSVPTDPFSSNAIENPLVYRLNSDGNSFELYSVGANLIDDNGKLSSSGGELYDQKGDVNLAAMVKYKEATTDAQRAELTVPSEDWE